MTKAEEREREAYLQNQIAYRDDLVEKAQREADRAHAECEGWKLIARRVLCVAYDLPEDADFQLPPIELFSKGWSSPDTIKLAVKNWWRGLVGDRSDRYDEVRE